MDIKIRENAIMPVISLELATIAHKVYGESLECGNGKVINYMHEEVFHSPSGNTTVTVNHLIPEEYDARNAQK